MTEATTTQATEAAKAPAVITTAKHARFLAEAARTRATKLQASAAVALIAAGEYDALALTLPEVAPSAPRSRPTFDVGAQVAFRYGRNVKGSTSRVLEGFISARKETDGKVEAYKITVGSGFEQTLYTVYPGSILVDGVAEDDNKPGDTTGDAPSGDADMDAALNSVTPAVVNSVEGL